MSMRGTSFRRRFTSLFAALALVATPLVTPISTPALAPLSWLGPTDAHAVGELSDFAENKLLDHLMGADTYTPPATVFVALYTSACNDAGGGTEVTGGSYARVSVANNLTNWPAATGGSKSNGIVIQFPTPTASWGTVTHVGILDAATLGNLLWCIPLVQSQTINIGNDVKFPVGDLDLSFD